MIEHLLETGGSGTGISYYESVIECPRRTQLDQVNRELGRANWGTKQTLTGTFMHAFLEIYYRGGSKLRGYDTQVVQFSHKGTAPTFWEEAQMEGARLFRAYRTKFPPNELGRVVATEKFLLMDEPAWWLPTGLPLTCRIDMVVKLSKKDCQRLAKTRKLFGLRPGYYLVDFKSAAGFPPALFLGYELSHQFIGYPAMWNVLFPSKQVEGTIVSAISKETAPKFRSILIESPDEERLKILHRMLYRAKGELENSPRWANSKACNNWQRPCPYLVSEECPRY